MKYCSTRGGVRGASFQDVISTGYAADGGLFVPETLPQMSTDKLRQWRTLDFVSLAEAIFSIFIGDELGPEELRDLVRSCYAGFGCDEIVPVRRVGGLFISELFHGPTFCFKDLGLSPLVRLLARFAEKRGKRHTLLVSTTGDTGPAAMHAVSGADSPNIDIVVFYPEGQISDLQRRQMTTCSSHRARVVTFQGGGDDMDLPLKRLASDRSFAEEYGLCGINSYNLVRPIAQTIHYFWTYFRVLDQLGLEVGATIDIVLPAGALGNLAAGFMAKRMGLPLRRLVAGTNSNDITYRTISRGEFHRNDHMDKTLSDAINIQVPYNMERVFYYLTGENSSLVKSWMAEMDRTAKLTLPKEWLEKLQETFESRRVDDKAMCAALRSGLERHGYLADPHTAVALSAAWAVYGDLAASSGRAEPAVAVLATASPCKFEVAVTEAVGSSHWAAYAESDAFPAAGRAVLAAAENPVTVFQRCGSLAETQATWQSAVRAMLSPPGHSKL